MKKVVSLLLVSVLLFTLSFSCFAVSAGVDFGLSFVQNVATTVYSSYSNSSQKKIEAARSYYFYCISNDTFSSGCDIFDSSGKKFTDEILEFYYKSYVDSLTCDVYVSEGDVFLRAAGFNDTPFSLSLLSFSFSLL